jgi:hypothetical protein
MTGVGAHADLLAGLPAQIGELARVVQGSLIHVFWAERYGRKLSEAEQVTLNVRDVEHKLAALRQVNPAPLVEPRPLEQRQVGNCRDFSTLLCALLRHQGIPARARCGFGTYFTPGRYEDHWMCEYWHAAEQRWVQVDVQLDDFQQKALQIDFDPLDMPPGKFVLAGEAYQRCRAGKANPDDFGIFDMHGLDFIQGNVVREFLALNKVEILPWDWGWGFLNTEKFKDLEFFDRLAALTAAADASFDEIRAIFEADPSLGVPVASH